MEMEVRVSRWNISELRSPLQTNRGKEGSRRKGRGEGSHVPGAGRRRPVDGVLGDGCYAVKDNSGDDGTTVDRVVFERQLLAVLFSEGQVERRDRPRGIGTYVGEAAVATVELGPPHPLSISM